jgi:hypothetical protein
MVPINAVPALDAEHVAVQGTAGVQARLSRMGGDIDCACRNAAALAGRMIAAGVNAFSPIAHSHTVAIASGMNALDADLWLEHEGALMEASDALVIAEMDGWEESYGVGVENDVFKSADKPRFRIEPETLEVKVHG